MVTVARKAAIFVVPATIIVAAFFAYPHLSTLPPARQELAQIAPYWIAVIGMFLAVHFHRGRPFFILGLLCLFYWTCRSVLAEGTGSLAAEGTFHAFALLLPFNITLFSFLRERGILTTAGKLRIAFLALQGIIASQLFLHNFADLKPLVTKKLLHFPPLDLLAVPQPALIATAVGAFLIALRAARRQCPIDSGFLGALAALFIACNWISTHDITAVFCTAAALIVTLSVIQDSYNMAFRDDLTGIPSRRALNESLLGLGRSYTIAMVDVDHFKKFNDTYGHDVGDQVLKMVAKKMSGVGGGGRAYRYGGEEFTILFSRRRSADCLPHLEELRKTIEEYRLFIRGSERPKDGKQGRGARGGGAEGTYVSVTVSIGVAETGEDLNAPGEVIRAADKALYKAKNKGRNQVCKA